MCVRQGPPGRVCWSDVNDVSCHIREWAFSERKRLSHDLSGWPTLQGLEKGTQTWGPVTVLYFVLEFANAAQVQRH